jgi:DNA polymerase
MRRELAAVYDELVRRQQAGEKSIYLSEEALSLLKESAAQAPEKKPVLDEPVVDIVPKKRPKKVAKKVAKPVIEVPAPPSVELPEGNKQTRWEALREQVISDEWCQSQLKPGKKVVFGVGSVDSKIFFCGEAPGADEEVLGEPFVGPAGQLLTKIIQAMGVQRSDVYIGNIMNYRPPMPTPVGNRAPELNEMAYCLPFLKAQLQVVQPDVIVALGNTAMEGLMGHDPKRRITKIRGQWMEFEGIPLIPTFHPSYLLRNQSLSTTRLVWEDIKLGMPVSEKQRAFFQ